jgi:hypothetical protein
VRFWRKLVPTIGWNAQERQESIPTGDLLRMGVSIPYHLLLDKNLMIWNEGSCDRRVMSSRPVWAKKLVRPYLQKQARWVWWYMSVIPATQEAEIGGSKSQGLQGEKSGDPI